jgi:hypothetical protein
VITHISGLGRTLASRRAWQGAVARLIQPSIGIFPRTKTAFPEMWVITRLNTQILENKRGRGRRLFRPLPLLFSDLESRT